MSDFITFVAAILIIINWSWLSELPKKIDRIDTNLQIIVEMGKLNPPCEYYDKKNKFKAEK